MENKPLSAPAQALVDALKSHPGEVFTFAELAEIAGVEPKTGYLRSVEANLGDALVKGEVEKIVERKSKVNTYTFVE